MGRGTLKRKFALALVLSFAGGVLLMAGVGGVVGIFDRGPSELEASEARERGYAEATAEVDARLDGAIEERSEAGYRRGREAAEWLSLDRLPNPDGWFAGVTAGRKKLEELAHQAYQAGYAAGEQQGRDEALGAVRMADEQAPPPDAAGQRQPSGVR